LTANLLYAVGTLCAWVGVVLLLRSAFLATRRLPSAPLAAGLGGASLLVAALTPAFQGGFGIPLLWIAMPFTGWACATCLIFATAKTLQGAVDERPRWQPAALWLVGAVFFAWLYRLDPENKVAILRGHIALSPVGALALLALAAAAVGAMVGISRRKRGSKLAIHAALLAGSFVFGLPFAWLLITSFKEDRDMASPNGVVWVPRVQRTVPYSDPENPLLEGTFRGNWVQATLAGRMSNGDYVVEVQRPSSLRGVSFNAPPKAFKVVPKDAPVVEGQGFTGFVAREMDDGRRLVRYLTPESLKGQEKAFLAADLEPVRDIGLRTQNYVEALEAMPPETRRGLVYLRNTLILVVLNVIGTVLSSSLVAFGFARLRFPGRDLLFKILLATMMLPGAVTLLPQFLLFRSFGWVDTLLPLWVPAFFAGAFNVFLLRQFFAGIPNELEDAGKIDGASVLRTFWTIMLPQVKPALAVVAIWTFMGAWNNFMGPLLYVNTPENMPLSYALQLFQSERGGEPGLMMAFATMTLLPVLALFFFAQRYFIEGVTLSGLGGR
jgi:multiple sugar transport system permease protein